jgi:hypothetical protein
MIAVSPVPVAAPAKRVGLLLSLAPYLVAILLALPALNAPFFEDDVYHRGMLSLAEPGIDWHPLALYEFVDATHPARLLRDHGLIPWFSADDLRIRFFRPLSSATLALDYYLFGERPWAARLQSLAWFFAALWLTGVVLGRVLSARAASWATLLYSLAAGHAMPVSWIAARHGLVSTVLGLLCVRLHLAWRQQGWTNGRWLALVMFAVSLTSGEMVLGTLGLLGAWELFGRRNRLANSLAALAPYAAIAAAYLVFYAASGYGPRGGAYLSPGDPTAVVQAVRQFGGLIGDLVAGIPADLSTQAPVTAQWILAAIGFASALIGVGLLRALRNTVDPLDRSALVWLPIASAAAAAPGSFALIGGRVLTLALVPASGVLAIALLGTVAAVRDRTLRGGARATFGAAAAVLILMHVVVAAGFRLLLVRAMGHIAVVQTEETARVAGCAGTVFIVAAADPTVSMYVPATRDLEGQRPDSTQVLSMSSSDQRVENVTRTGFDIAVAGEPQPRTVWEVLFRAAPMTAGTSVAVPSFTATVLEDRDGTPMRTRFEFSQPLDSGSCFVAWRGGHLSTLPALTPGTRVDLPYEPGPMKQ